MPYEEISQMLGTTTGGLRNGFPGSKKISPVAKNGTIRKDADFYGTK